MLVYVLNKDGKPLMPCKSVKARILLRQKKAKVIRREPFTIQLLYGSSGYKQPVTLGVDAGAKHIGLSASTKSKELYSSDVELRTDIVDLLSTRRELRRGRRSRKTRYRKARFDNRKKPEGWLAPSVQNRINSHISVIEKVCRIMPVTKIIVETASFDIQKIRNPEIEGAEYQQGEQLDFWNVREYVLFRDEHTCQYCHGKSKDTILNVHHIESRKTGGNAPNNLITLCETCHKAYHAEKIKLGQKRGQSFKEASFMGIMRWALLDKLREIYLNVQNTYGYITKNNRIRLGLPKEHYVDAYCIAGNLEAERLPYYWYQKQVRKHNRQIHKTNFIKGGIRKRNQTPYVVFGFRLFDKVIYKGETGFIFGRRSSGSFLVKRLDGEKISAGISYKKLKLIGKRNTYLTERREVAPPPHVFDDTDLIPLPRMSEYLLDDFMTPMGLTAQDVSKGTGISLHDVRAILANMREITPEISEKLGEYFGVSAMLFYDIQQDLKARAEMRKFSNRVIVLPDTAKNGKNIQNVIQTMKEALNILNAAVPASA